jgi:hypothetical protein
VGSRPPATSFAKAVRSVSKFLGVVLAEGEDEALGEAQACSQGVIRGAGRRLEARVDAQRDHVHALPRHAEVPAELVAREGGVDEDPVGQADAHADEPAVEPARGTGQVLRVQVEDEVGDGEDAARRDRQRDVVEKRWPSQVRW